jgi:adenine-specific DNA-methyltransferase
VAVEASISTDTSNQLELGFDANSNLLSQRNSRGPWPPSPAYKLRLVNYLGSKLRGLNPILAAVEELAPRGGFVCDLFAGSGVVSLAMSERWSVTAVDIQEYSRVLCNAVLNPIEGPSEIAKRLVDAARNGRLRRDLRSAMTNLLEHEKASIREAVSGSMDHLADLLDRGSLRALDSASGPESNPLDALLRQAQTRLHEHGLGAGPDTVVTRYYGAVYFSWEQAIDLDAILKEIHGVKDRSTRDYFLAALLAVASEAVNSVGKQFAQPIRPRDSAGHPKRHLLRQTLRDRSIDIFDAYHAWLDRLAAVPRPVAQHHAQRRDFREALADAELRADVVYADPPYTRDHYSRYYHALETMALRDEPEVSTTSIRTNGSPRVSRGVYRSNRHQSPFSIKSQAPGAFDELCAGVRSRGVPLVLSYSPFNPAAGNRPRLLTTDEVAAIARLHFRDVELRDVGGYAHNKLNVAARNVSVAYVAEVILVCIP